MWLTFGCILWGQRLVGAKRVSNVYICCLDGWSLCVVYVELFVSQSFINTSLFPHLFLILVVFRSVSHGLHRLSASSSSSRKTFITWTQRTHVTCSLQDDQHVRTAQIRVKQEESVTRQRTVSVDNPLINNSASSSVQLISVDTHCLAADGGDDYDETSSISSRLPLCNFIRHQSSTISCRRQTERIDPRDNSRQPGNMPHWPMFSIFAVFHTIIAGRY